MILNGLLIESADHSRVGAFILEKGNEIWK